MMRNNIKSNLNNLHLSDIYSLILFVLFKVQDIPEYALTSELCYLLDGANMTRLLTYFAGKTVTFPTESEMKVVTNALLMYQYINIDGETFTAAQNKLDKLTKKEKEAVTDLYVKLLPIMKQYNIDRSQIQKR
jgi:GTP-binding protein EngB required for normal cell division